jgi:hypothetical protein
MRWIITDDDIDGVACTRGTATKKRVGANAETVTPPRRTAMAASIFTIIILFLNDDVEENDSLLAYHLGMQKLANHSLAVISSVRWASKAKSCSELVW